MTPWNQRHFLPSSMSVIGSFAIREQTAGGIKGPYDLHPLVGVRIKRRARLELLQRTTEGKELKEGNNHTVKSKCASANFLIILIA